MSTDDIEEIGIVGIGCRFPGANDIHEFWELLERGENHVKDIPKDRWDNDKIYSEDFDEPGKIYVKKAGLLSEHDKWDNRLFGISDREAIRIDPQQRYVLECTHMALEDGGLTRKDISGTNTGVFIGVMNDDYKSLMGTDHNEDTNFTATGLSTTVMASRVSYVYNLHGPCMTLDTACSSAMMALHLGCQAIRAGECEIAICGGVSSILSPDMFFPLCKARMLSKTGQCQTFCNTADGYARSEGCGIIILQSTKSPSKVKNLWGILQTGINQDGRAATPMTAPSSQLQQELLHKVYTKYKVNPADLDYIEVHGTGTPIGDPTEVDAISSFIQSTLQKTKDDNDSRKILMGSVKTNIGHTESAAAVAGIIKVLLMMKHGKIVKSLHIKEDKSNLNERIKLDETKLDIAVRNTNWSQNKLGNRVACVNSFGFGGSNGHAVIKQRNSSFNVCDDDKENAIEDSDITYFVSLCGRDKASLSKNVECFINDTIIYPDKLHNISYTSLNYRDNYEHRKLLYGKTLNEICESAHFESLQAKEPGPGLSTNTVFVFCGVGTAWPKMGTEMMKKHAVFLRTVRKVNEYMKEHSNCDVEEILNFTESYNDPFLNHVAIFTVQVALYELWKSLGIIPDTIIGQSVGEVAAAYASGAIDLSSAVKVIYHRSKILAQKREGAMTVIGNLPLSQIENVTLMPKYHGNVNIAVYNSPTSCTLSGSETAIKDLEKDISSNEEAFIRSLNVVCAYHSHLMEDCLQDISTALHGLECSNETHTPHISTVTGQTVKQTEMTSSVYWAQNVRKPVLFMQAVRKSAEDECKNIFLEIGPRQVLRAHLSNILSDGQKYVCLPSMNRNDEHCLYNSLTVMYELGVDVDFLKLMPYKGGLASLPKYHFNRTSPLFISSLTKRYLSGLSKSKTSNHYTEMVNEDTFNIHINQESTPFVFDHKLLGNITVPGATYVEAVIASACEILKIPYDIIELSASFENPCMIRQGSTTVLNASFKQSPDLGNKYLEYSILDNERILCKGHVNERKPYEYNEIDIKALKMRLTRYTSADEVYKVLEKIGLTYGESLHLIKECFFMYDECIAVIHIPDSIKSDVKNYSIHPAIVDAILQSAGVLSGNSGSRSLAGIPKGFKSLKVYTAMQENMFVYTKLTRTSRINSYYTSILLTEKGTIIAELDDLTIRSIGTSIPNDNISYELSWFDYEMPSQDLSRENKKSEDLIVIGTERLRAWLLKGNSPFTFIDVRSDQNQLKRLTMEAFEKSKRGKRLIFGPCLNYNGLSGLDNVEIYNIIKSNAISLKTIFNTKQSMVEYTFSVFVVTEMTQESPQKTLLEKTNFLGSELWGFTRSAMTEMPNEDIRLIDVDLQEKSIQAFLSLVLTTETKVPESLIRNGCIYINEIRSSATQDITTTNTGIVESSVPLNLYSKSPNDVSEPFLAFTKGTSNTTVIPVEQKKVKVATIYINSNDRMNTKTNITLDANLSSEFEICTNEFVGWILNEKNMKEEDVDHGVCFPVNVATIVRVPTCCYFKLKDIPFYKPGLISEMVILWKVRKLIKANSNALIVISQNDNWRANVLVRLLQRHNSKGKIACWADLSSLESSSERFSHAIIVQFENTRNISLLNGIIGLQQVISVNSWLPWDPISVSLQNKVHTKVLILRSEDMLNEKCSMKLVPKVLKYLKLDSNYMEKISDTCASYNTIDIQTTAMETKIPIVCFPSSCFKKDGYYIFVGGTSGLGWELLKYCAQLGAGNLITISRRGLTKEKKTEIERVENLHRCKILHIQADVTNIDSLQNGFNILRNKNANVKGIFNGAGVLKDTLLHNMTPEDLETALRPKVLGTLNLHSMSQGISLDFFITHSSITAIFGNPGQCNYAAGNSFQDSFAHFRASEGLNAQSINWGALPFGMARESGPDFENRFRRQGIHILNDNDVRTCFNEIVLTKDIQKVFGIFDWQRFMQNPIYTSSLNKYKSMTQDIVSMQKGNLQQSADIEFIPSEFQSLPLGKKQECLTNIVMLTLKDSLMIETESLEPNTGLFQLGIDSMSAMGISNILHQYTSIRVPVVFLLSNTASIEGLISFLVRELESPNVNDMSVNEEPMNNDILDGSVTFMQASILKHLDTEKPENFIRSICYEIKTRRRIGTRKWTHILIMLLNLHPGLRQIFVSDTIDGSFQSKEIEINNLNAPIDKVSFHGIFQTSTEVHLDPRSQIPVKFHLASKGRTTRMKLFLHAVIVDMQSIHLLFRDLEICTRHYMLGEKPLHAQNVDVAGTVRIALTPMFKSMQTFWKNQFSVNFEPFSFSQAILNTLDEGEWREIGHRFTDSQFDNVISFIRQEKITLYNFVLSVYFLCIYESTGVENIPLITNTNIRGFIPALENVLTRCINEVPVVGRVNPKMTVSEYLQETALQLNMITEHGAYPYEMIKQEMKSETLQQHIGRHRFIIDDVSNVSRKSDKKDATVKITAVRHRRRNYETCLFIYHDTHGKTLSLDLGYNSEALCTSSAYHILGRLECLMNHLTSCDLTVTIKDMLDTEIKPLDEAKKQAKDSFILEDVLGKSTASAKFSNECLDNKSYWKDLEPPVGYLSSKIIMSGTIEKQSAVGNVYDIEVTLKEMKPCDSKPEYRLCWTYFNDVRQISLESITEIHMKKIGGRYCILLKNGVKGWLQFNAKTYPQAKLWFDQFKSAIESYQRVENYKDELCYL